MKRCAAGSSLPLLVTLAGFLLLALPLGAKSLYSPTWGFTVDLPAGFEYQDGDGQNRFSFSTPEGITLDIAAYPGSTYGSAAAMAADVQRRLNSRGDITVFDYHGREAALWELSLVPPRAQGTPGGRVSGWGLCLELMPYEGFDAPERAEKAKLLVLVFGPEGNTSLNQLYLSALDSIAPTVEDLYRPGPITEFAWPRGDSIEVRPAGDDVRAQVCAGDAEAAQSVVEREYTVLAYYAETPLWQEAWIRFYRFIFRDSYERLDGITRALIEEWFPGRLPASDDPSIPPNFPESMEILRRELPGKALAWVQAFTYERNIEGADFVDLVSAAVEGRGDCDSRALLWAMILEQANIHAAIMVSREYSHAMGLADITGAGARFDFDGIHWLVAETTAPVDLGQINARTADPAHWIGIPLH
jgi:hypothetical protein